MWKQLLKLRESAKNFLSCRIGDGNSCSFWFDNWTSFGELYSFLGRAEHQRLGLPLDSTVAKARTRDGWIFRGARSDNVERLLIYLAETELNNEERDLFLWASPNGNPRDQFTFSETWTLFNPPNPVVPWHDQVWFSGSIPKHSFIMWMCCLDRLPTLSRLRNWGIVEEDTCFLCEIFFETRDHLLLRCPYSTELWRWCCAKLQLPFYGFNSWELFLDWLKSPTHVAPLVLLRLVAAQTVVYALWHERNARIFKGTRTPAAGLFPLLDRGIRNTCSSRRLSPKFQGLLQLWFRSSSL